MRLARIDNRYLPIFHHHWRLPPHEEPVQLRGIVELEPGPQTPPESFFVKAPGQSLPGTIDQGERLHDRYPLRQFHGGTGSASAHRPAFTFRASLSSASSSMSFFAYCLYHQAGARPDKFTVRRRVVWFTL
jgi:hypothetical protein